MRHTFRVSRSASKTLGGSLFCFLLWAYTGAHASEVSSEIATARQKIPRQIGVELDAEKAALAEADAKLAHARAELDKHPSTSDTQAAALADLKSATAELAAARAGWESAAAWRPLEDARQRHKPVRPEDAVAADEKAQAFAAIAGAKWKPFADQHLQMAALLRRYAGADKIKAVLELPEDSRSPVMTTVTLADSKERDARVELTVRSAKQRRVTALLFDCEGCTHLQWLHASISADVRPEEPLTHQFSVPPRSRLTFVAFDPGEVKPSSKDVYGTPKQGAPLEAKNLWRHALFVRRGLAALPSPAQMQLAAEVFATIDPAFLTYAKTDAGACKLVPNEPILAYSQPEYRAGVEIWRLFRANGQVCLIASLNPRLSDYVTATKPPRIAMPPYIEPNWGASRDEWQDEEFLSEAAKNPRIAKYRDVKSKGAECAEAKWKQLDPSGVAHNYDVVTRNTATGQVATVENFYDRLKRQVDAACDLGRLWKERDTIRAGRSAIFEKAEKARLEELAKELSARSP